MGRLPKPVLAPPPGSVQHQRRPTATAPKRTLTDSQLAQAILHRAELGDAARLAELLADPRAKKKKTLDAALIAVCRTGTRAGASGEVDLGCLSALLAKGASPNARHDGTSALAYGMHQGIDFVRVMLDAGADPNGPGIVKGETVLHRAVEFADPVTVTALLDAGADPNAGSESPMQLAARGSLEGDIKPEMIDLLVARGAKVEGPKGGRTPLLWAVAEKRVEHVKRLLAHGADVNARDLGRLEQRALHVAFERNDDAVAKVLIQHGADCTLRDGTGLDMTTVYDAKGNRVEPEQSCTIRYFPSDEPQRVDFTLGLSVMRALLRNVKGRFDFDAAWWARVVACGVAGSDCFSPESGRARVLAPLELDDIKKAGTFERTFSLELAGVCTEFIRMMTGSLMATTTTFTGAGHIADARVISVSVEGALAGDMVADGIALRAFPGELPFPFRVETGTQSSLLVRTARKWKSAEEPNAITDHIEAWLATQSTWKRRDVWRSPAFSGVPQPDAPVIPIFQVGAGTLSKAFGYEVDDAVAVLSNAMRALHAKVPLAQVVFTWA